MKTIFNLCEKYFHNSNITTYFAVCQYIFEIFFMQNRTLKYFKYFKYFFKYKKYMWNVRIVVFLARKKQCRDFFLVVRIIVMPDNKVLD